MMTIRTTVLAGVAMVAIAATAGAGELRLTDAALDAVTAGELTVIELGSGLSSSFGTGVGGEFTDINLQSNSFGTIEFLEVGDGSLFAPPPPPPTPLPPIGGGGGGLGGVLGFLFGLLGN